MTPKEFSELASGIQSIAVVFAVISGGIWSWFTFGALAARRKARAEVAELERRLEQQGVVDVTVAAGQLVLPGTTQLCLRIDISVKNLGNRNVLVSLGREAILAIECVPYEPTVAAIMTYQVPYNVYWHRDARGDDTGVIRAGASWHFAVVAHVRRPGLYEVVVQIGLSPTEVEVGQRAGLAATNQVWNDRTLAVVEPVTVLSKRSQPIPRMHSTLLELLTAVESSLFAGSALVEQEGVPEAQALFEELAAFRLHLIYDSGGLPYDDDLRDYVQQWAESLQSSFPSESLQRIKYANILRCHHELVEAMGRGA